MAKHNNAFVKVILNINAHIRNVLLYSKKDDIACKTSNVWKPFLQIIMTRRVLKTAMIPNKYPTLPPTKMIDGNRLGNDGLLRLGV